LQTLNGAIYAEPDLLEEDGPAECNDFMKGVASWDA
jgi:hypothetical protein